ncbi:MAG TPA: glycosyltransferase [Casimicrobiaceae bacterium]|nr:glycosyltransferase [Casimicrobiaceae bacterium]
MSRNELCACGSGKRYKHCHGRDDAGGPTLPRLEALAAHRTGSLGRAEALYRRAIADNPDDLDSLHMLGVVQFERMRYREALDLLWDAAERTGWAVPDIRHNVGLVLAKLLSPRANARQEALLAAFVAWQRAQASAPAGTPRVSVVIPVHDQRQWLARAIASVGAQRYADIELIVVDDGSTDDSATVAADALARLAMPTRRMRQAHAGAAAAANAGAQAATGEYLAFLNADDAFMPERIAKMAAAIARATPQWGFSRVTEVDDDGRELRAADDGAPRPRNYLGIEPASFTLLDHDVTRSSGNLFVARTLFLALGGFRGDTGHRGWDFCVRAAERVEPVAVDEALYLHRIHDGNRVRILANPALRGIDRTAKALLEDALTREGSVANVLAPQHPANREFLLRAELRAGHGERVPVPVLRAGVARFRAQAAPGALAADGSSAEGDAARTALVVLGVHRSGTSALARVLNLCGAFLPERVMPAKLDVNPKGFWETEAVNDLDARLLNHLGGDWNRVQFELPREGPLVDEFVEDAKALLRSEYGDEPFILIKDPRVCVLAPLWQRALVEAGYRPTYVVPMRNPLEVARSLEARGDMAVPEGLALWLTYMERVEAFADTADADFVHVRYTDLLDDWRQSVARIAATLRVPLAIDRDATAVDDFLEADLRNHQAGADDLEAHLVGAQGDAIRTLYRRSLLRCDRDAAAAFAAAPEAGVTPAGGDGVAAATASFVLCIEDNAIREQALLLCASIRAFAGRHRDAEIVAYAPRPGLGVDAATQRMLRELNVTYVDEPLNVECRAYGSANRVAAAAHAEKHARGDFVVVLDSDTVWLDEPALPADADAAARPIDEKGSATRGPGDPFEAYWRALAALAGVELDQLPWMRTTISGERVRASYNGGLIVARRSAGILGRWAEIFFGSVRAGLRPYRDTGIDIVASMGAVGRESSEFWGSNQAALALAMWSGGHRVRHFADRYNVPLHLIALGGDIDSRWMAAPPAHVHYHAMFAARQHEVALDLLQRLGAGDDRLAWLRTRLPLVTHAARSADPALASS